MRDSQPSLRSRRSCPGEDRLFLYRVREGIRRRWRRLVIEIAGRIGQYNRWKEVEWRRVERLVFVCSGNICRSPYAEAVALSRGLAAISFGITARAGAHADPMAIEVADRAQIDMRNHCSRRFNESEIRDSDLLVVMEISHLKATQLAAVAVGAQTTLLGLWDGCQPVVIQDPFGQPTDEFEVCFRRIDSCIDKMQHARRETRHS